MARDQFQFAETPVILNEIHAMQYNPTTLLYMGTIASAAGPHGLELTGNTQTADLTVAARLVDAIALLTGYNFNLDLAGYDVSFLQVIAGATREENTATTVSNLYIPDSPDTAGGFPWVGLIGIGATSDGGIFTCGLPQAMIQNAPPVNMRGDQLEFSAGSVGGIAIFEDIRATAGDPFAQTVRRWATRAAFTVPADAAAFKAYFTEDLGAITPVAAFSSAVSTRTVTFTDTSTGVPSYWMWDFGDGFQANVQNPVHVYNAAGTRTVTLLVRNTTGQSVFTAAVTVT